MKVNRRGFLGFILGGIGAWIAARFGLDKAVPKKTVVEAAAAVSVAEPIGYPFGPYGAGVRGQVFEVIVRQAMAGAPWREICAGPMDVNRITIEEVETEVARRKKLLG